MSLSSSWSSPSSTQWHEERYLLEGESNVDRAQQFHIACYSGNMIQLRELVEKEPIGLRILNGLNHGLAVISSYFFCAFMIT